MPTPAEHVARGHMHERFSRVRSASTPGDAEWKVISAFYAAVHYVESVIVAKNGDSSKSHEARNQYVRTWPEFGAFRSTFLTLYTSSKAARYDPAAPSFAGQPTQDLCDELVNIRRALNIPTP